jgi:hypothetical protein
MTLHGPIGTAFGIAFLLLWAYAMFCALMVIRNSNSKWKWYGTFWPAHTLTPEGLRYRRRYYITVAIAFVLFGLAWLVLPH